MSVTLFSGNTRQGCINDTDDTVTNLLQVFLSQAAFYWLEDRDCIVALLSNVGTMHIESDMPGAGTLGRDPRLVEIARRATSDGNF